MKVSAVIVTYNRLNLLKECLTHLLHQDYKLDKIFVVNNNSSDNTKSYLDNINNDMVIPVNLTKNLGGAGGFSIGTKMAYQKSNSNYFWLMDDDSMPTSSALNNLMKKAQELKYNFGFLCSNVRWWKDMSAALTNIPKPSFDWNQSLKDNLVKVDSTSFVSVLFSRNSVTKLGLPIGQMFIWGDDVEFTTRLSRNNSNSYLVTNSIVLHKSKVNKAYNVINNSRITFYKYGIRNKIFLKRKYFNTKDLLKQLLSYLFVLIKIPFCAKNKRFKRIMCVITGIIKGFFFNPKIIYPRRG